MVAHMLLQYLSTKNRTKHPRARLCSLPRNHPTRCHVHQMWGRDSIGQPAALGNDLLRTTSRCHTWVSCSHESLSLPELRFLHLSKGARRDRDLFQRSTQPHSIHSKPRRQRHSGHFLLGTHRGLSSARNTSWLRQKGGIPWLANLHERWISGTAGSRYLSNPIKTLALIGLAWVT